MQEVARKLFATLYNTYSFFALYANVDNFTGEEPQVPVSERPEIDRWILSLLNSLIATVDEALADYEPTKAARAINEFVNDHLSNWYVRLNRKRFWGGEMTQDKLAAYQTLYTCLKTLSLLIAPISPFFADRLYRDLDNGQDSVHLAMFPEVDASLIDEQLEKRMAAAQTITSLVLSLRRKANVKVRQPLQEIMIPAIDDEQRKLVESMRQLILTEVNVKTLKIVGGDEGVLVKKIKPDFKVLGKKLGKLMKSVAKALQEMDQQSIMRFEKDGKIAITIAESAEPVEIELADVEVISEDIPGWLVANEGNMTVALDITVTPELRKEGIARDIVNRVQNIRKSRDYEITDRINLVFGTNPETDDAIAEFSDYIAAQVLATSVVVSANCDAQEELDIDGILLPVNITKAL